MFTPRFTKPEKGNKYYITKANGGYSDAIKGTPTDSDCDVLSNCVGYAYGRFNEIGQYGYCKYLCPTNAELFIKYCGGLSVGQVPKLGACMVWQKGNTLNANDGAGHVAIVESIVSPTEIVTSESAWNGSAFYTTRRVKGTDNKWGMSKEYTFLGFIYNPAVDTKLPKITVNSKIATQPSATFKQVLTFLKNHNASSTFMNLSEFYYFYASLIGIDPVFSICQSALEENWLTYKGCLITPDMKNTAGIKKSDADITKYFNEHPEDKSKGSDCIKACHQSFNRWSESIVAQIDHAGLYAGLSGYPSEHTYDPRHFTWCYGLGKTIADFCTHYSTAEYSKSIVALMNEVVETKEEEVTFVRDANIAKDVSSMLLEIMTFYGLKIPSSDNEVLYRVRLSWDNANSQKGAFAEFDNAKKCSDANGTAYGVYDSKGNKVYPFEKIVEIPTGIKQEDFDKIKAANNDLLSRYAGAYASNMQYEDKIKKIREIIGG